MRRIESALRAAAGDLRQLSREFALLGGFAVSAHCEPRTTKDVDLAVLVSGDEDAEQLAFQLSQRGYVVTTTIEQTQAERLATIRTVSPSGAIVDLLFASCGFEPEIIAAATVITILDGLQIPVATVGHLIAMKVLARDDRHRPQDRVDLQALFKVASARDFSDARCALGLVLERGYGRGRALHNELEAAVTELGPEG